MNFNFFTTKHSHSAAGPRSMSGSETFLLGKARGPPPIPIKSEYINKLRFCLTPQIYYPSGTVNYYNPNARYFTNK